MRKLLCLVFGVSVCFACQALGQGADVRREMSLIEGKPVIAHYMTGINQLSESWRVDPKGFVPGGLGDQIGGSNQYLSLLALRAKQKGLLRKQMVYQEIIAAQKMGIDGFHFLYVMWPSARADGSYLWHDVIALFFEVCKEKKLDFKLTLCLSSPTANLSQAEKIKKWGKQINTLMDQVGRDHPNWLRTRDGRIAMMSWNPDALSDLVKHNGGMINDRDAMKVMRSVKRAYDQLFAFVKIKAMLVYDMHTYPNISGKKWFDRWYPKYVQACAEHFEMLASFVPVLTRKVTRQRWALVNQICKEKKTGFVQGAFLDLYDSKVFWKENGKLINHPRALKKARVDQIKKHFIPLRGSENYRACLANAKTINAQMISVTTWNDFPEGHHLAPSIDHQYGPSVLLHHYKDLWRGRAGWPRDFAMVTYRKYAWGKKPSHFNIAMSSRTKGFGDQQIAKLMDVVEVVTILKEDARVMINGKLVGEAPAGVHAVAVPMHAGQVNVQVILKSGKKLALTPTEWITDKPYRTDRSLVCWSSEKDWFSQLIFGDDAKTQPVLDEYAQDAQGIAHWKKQYQLD